MEVIKETKYLRFEIKEQKAKTKVISVINKSGNYEIAEIAWYGHWRQYVFESYDGMVWNTTCLQDVISVINDLMKERQVIKPVKD